MERSMNSRFLLIGYIFCLLMGGGNCQISNTEKTSTEESVIITLSSTSSQSGETSSPPLSIISPTATEPSPVTEMSPTQEFLTSTHTELHNITSLSNTQSSLEVDQESETAVTTLINIFNTTDTQAEVEFTPSSPSLYNQTNQYSPYTEGIVAAEQDTDYFTFTSTQHDKEASSIDLTMPSTLRASLVSLSQASTSMPILSTTHFEESTHALENASSTTEPIKTGESSTEISTTMSAESTSQIMSIPSSSESIITSTRENTTSILSTTPNSTTHATQTDIYTPSVITRIQTTAHPITTQIFNFATNRTTFPSITQTNILQEGTDLTTGDDDVKSSVSTTSSDPDADNTTRIEAISRTDIQRIYWTKNEIIVVIVVMFVLNVFNLIVVVLCVMHIVNNRSQRWEPPPSRFGSRSRYTNSRPQLECVRTMSGCDLASDSECKSEEKPLKTVSIISKDSGWCVPIEEQKKKEAQTADTGV